MFTMNVRLENLAILAAGLKAHARDNPGTVWDLLPKTAEEIVSLIGPCRTAVTSVDFVGMKLRVLQAGGATLPELYHMRTDRLLTFDVNKKPEKRGRRARAMDYPQGATPADRKGVLIAAVLAHAEANPDTEWNLLPKSDDDIVALIGSRRTAKTCVEAIGQALRVLKAGAATFQELINMTDLQLQEFDVNKKPRRSRVRRPNIVPIPAKEELGPAGLAVEAIETANHLYKDLGQPSIFDEPGSAVPRDEEPPSFEAEENRASDDALVSWMSSQDEKDRQRGP